MRYVLQTIIAILAIIAVEVALAQIVDPQNVLIRNVHLVEGDAGAATAPVNILIRNNRLELISQDEPEARPG